MTTFLAWYALGSEGVRLIAGVPLSGEQAAKLWTEAQRLERDAQIEGVRLE